MKRLLTSATAALFAFPAFAQQSCAPRDAVMVQLAARYGETRQAIGLGSNGNAFETFANTETGSWTIIITRPTGISCLVAAGQSFAIVSEKLPPDGDPT